MASAAGVLADTESTADFDPTDETLQMLVEKYEQFGREQIRAVEAGKMVYSIPFNLSSQYTVAETDAGTVKAEIMYQQRSYSVHRAMLTYLEQVGLLDAYYEGVVFEPTMPQNPVNPPIDQFGVDIGMVPRSSVALIYRYRKMHSKGIDYSIDSLYALDTRRKQSKWPTMLPHGIIQKYTPKDV